MGRISPGPTRWPPGAERRQVPAKSNLKPHTFVCYAHLKQDSQYGHLLALCVVRVVFLRHLNILRVHCGLIAGHIYMEGTYGHLRKAAAHYDQRWSDYNVVRP